MDQKTIENVEKLDADFRVLTTKIQKDNLNNTKN